MQPNNLLRKARERTVSRSLPGEPMSRRELAEAANAWLWETTVKRYELDAHSIARYERGVVRWPNAHYRAALRHVLRAVDDSALGFAPPGAVVPRTNGSRDTPSTVDALGFKPANRRAVSPLTFVQGINGVLNPDDSDRLAYVTKRPRHVDRAALDSLAVVLAQQRRLEDTIGAAPLIEPVCAYMRTLESMVLDAQGSLRPAVVDTAAQWAQFTAWLHAATDQVELSNRWFDRTLAWATEAINPTLAANALSFKGYIASRMGHVGPVITLSQAAQRDPRVDLGQRTYDTIQEARGHAMADDIKSADYMLGKAGELIAMFVECPNEMAPWSYYYSQPMFSLERGVVFQHLGRYADAAEQIIAGLSELPKDQASAEWTVDYRHMARGGTVGSMTIGKDLQAPAHEGAGCRG